MRAKPLSFREASAFVAKYHRHNKPPRGCKFCVGVLEGDKLVGVLMCGRPVSRLLDNTWTLEINRTCTDGTKNANSFLYGVARQIAKAMGYTRIITYTQQDETGASLKAAGFVMVKRLAARKGWRESSGPANKNTRAVLGTGDVSRVLWEVRFHLE